MHGAHRGRSSSDSKEIDRSSSLSPSLLRSFAEFNPYSSLSLPSPSPMADQVALNIQVVAPGGNAADGGGQGQAAAGAVGGGAGAGANSAPSTLRRVHG